MLAQLFSPSPVKREAYETYAQIVSQARDPRLFQEFAIPDTLDGRFEAIVLHLFVHLEAWEKQYGKEREEFSRLVMEAFFADMDRSLRELGVGDTGVGRRVKQMAKAFYGHAQAYRETIDNREAFVEALKRNAYGTLKEIPAGKPERLAEYVYGLRK